MKHLAAAGAGAGAGGRQSSPLLLAPAAAGAKMTSARDSKLTCVLGPLLQGNCRTVFLSYLKDGEEHYKVRFFTTMSPPPQIHYCPSPAVL